MPVDYTGLMLKPSGFFDRNPALNVPAASNGHCHTEGDVHGPAKDRRPEEA